MGLIHIICSTTLSLSGSGDTAVPGAYGWRSTQDESPAHCSAHCYVNNCGISTLLKGPSALLWRRSGTFPYCQKKCFVCTGLEQKTVCFSAQSSKNWATIFSHFTLHLNYSSISSIVQFNNKHIFSSSFEITVYNLNWGQLMGSQ